MSVSNPALLANDSEIRQEQALVERARNDGDAFAGLYDRYVGRVYRYAYRRLGSHEDAEDVTAQTFHRALEALPHYEARGLPFGAWLFRIAHNLVVDRRRAPPRALSLDGTEPLGEPAGARTPDPDEAVILREELDAAWTAVATLPPMQRRAVALRFGRGLSHAEVGPLIGRSEAATKQLIYRAMKTLRRQLEAGG